MILIVRIIIMIKIDIHPHIYFDSISSTKSVYATATNTNDVINNKLIESKMFNKL